MGTVQLCCQRSHTLLSTVVLQGTTKVRTEDFNLEMNKNDRPDTTGNLSSTHHSCHYYAKSGKQCSAEPSNISKTRVLPGMLEKVSSQHRVLLNGKPSAVTELEPSSFRIIWGVDRSNFKRSKAVNILFSKNTKQYFWPTLPKLNNYEYLWSCFLQLLSC